jgi:predicted ATPase/class 3 adenylate cyclase
VHDAASGTVTFLFTDLEGSTRLWEDFPNAMQHALARHDAILRDAMLARDGQIVKTTGDGIHAAFASAHDALAAAANAERAIVTEPWGVTGPLRVRIGVHTGDAEMRDGDYYGPAVNRAARLMDAANGGQILVSLATEELARDMLDDDLGFVDLGEHRLRDLARPERIFQLTGPGLPDNFAPPASLDSAPGNLPPQLTPFIGREQAIVDTAEALRDVRLVTITGTGGVGKTRLALQSAAHSIDDYPDGAWLCELGVANDDDVVVQIVAGALGVTPRPGMSLEESVLAHLRTKQLLLILDNCEHVLDVTGRLADRIVRECPEVRVLATSREALAVDGELIRPLRSLSLPDVSDSTDVVATSDAVVLFIDRARAARPGFVDDASNLSAIAEICRRLDGIPLAIQLAAARVVSMNPTEIVALVDERFRLLTGGRRSAVERHQTLRAAVDWSYSLLTEAEQRVFARLSVFSSSFTGADATAVVTGDAIDAWDVIDVIGSLVAKSMLNADESAEGATRYRELETLRQYARERLEDSDDPDAWRRRHAEHYATFAEQANAGLRSADELTWRPRVMSELDNLRAAVAWSVESEKPDDNELGVRIVASLASEANAGRTLEVGSWAERALPLVGRSTPARRAAVLGAAAWNAILSGNLDLGAERSRAVLQEHTPGVDQASAYIQLAYMASIRGSYDEAIAILDEGLAELDASPPPDKDLAVLMKALLVTGHVGMVLVGSTQHPEPGSTRGTEAVLLAEESGHPTSVANALFVNALEQWRVDSPHAEPLIDKSVALVRAGASAVMYPIMLSIKGLMRANADDTAGTCAAFHEALLVSSEKGDLPVVASALEYSIQALAAVGEPETAATISGGLADWLRALATYPAYEVPHREQALQQARLELGDDGYTAATARGQTMSLDQLVGYALAELDRISGADTARAGAAR